MTPYFARRRALMLREEMEANEGVIEAALHELAGEKIGALVIAGRPWRELFPLVRQLSLLGLARAGSTLFWHVRSDMPSGASGASAPLVTATGFLLAASVAMSVFAGPLQRYSAAAAEQLRDRKAYADAVLGEQGGLDARTTRPYTGQAGGSR